VRRSGLLLSVPLADCSIRSTFIPGWGRGRGSPQKRRVADLGDASGSRSRLGLALPLSLDCIPKEAGPAKGQERQRNEFGVSITAMRIGVSESLCQNQHRLTMNCTDPERFIPPRAVGLIRIFPKTPAVRVARAPWAWEAVLNHSGHLPSPCVRPWGPGVPWFSPMAGGHRNARGCVCVHTAA